MRRLLLIIILIMMIFQLVVIATAIDIGNTASDRDTTRDVHYTRIDGNVPATGTGKITTVEIWANAQMADCEVATFTQGASNVFTTRDYESIGNVTAGSKQTFTVNLDVVTGDFIGIYGSDGSIEATASGVHWYYLADKIPCTDTTFTAGLAYTISLHGIGATTEAPAGNAIMMGINF